MAYIDSPPVIGDVRYGKNNIGYPIELTEIEDYRNLVDQLVYAQKRKGVWLIEPPCLKKGGIYVCLMEIDKIEIVGESARAGMIVEINPDTFSLHTERQISTTGNDPSGVGGGRDYFWSVDRMRSELFEYRTDTMARQRQFRLGGIGQFFPAIPGVTLVPWAVGGSDEVLYLFGRSNFAQVMYIVDVVGADRELVMRPPGKILMSTIDVAANAENYITGGGGDEDFIYICTRHGDYYKLHADTLEIAASDLNNDHIPTGFGGDGHRCFSTYVIDAGSGRHTGFFQERSVVDLTPLNPGRDFFVPFFLPVGIGGVAELP